MTVTVRLEGHVRNGGPHWLYCPFAVPEGVRALRLTFSYDRAHNEIELALFDPRGHEPGQAHGFRGWSDSEREQVSISAHTATPGYLPGPLPAGVWQLMVEPDEIAPGGADWHALVELELGADESSGPESSVRERSGPERSARPAGAPAATGPGWYRGDLHLHTLYSDGGFTLDQVIESAREARLDFVASTEHNTPAAHTAWAYRTGVPIEVINGVEVTTPSGHFNAIGLDAGAWVDWRLHEGDGRFAPVARDLRSRGVFTVVNHPFAPWDGGNWRFGFDDVDAVEVWNGSEDALVNERALELWDGLLRAGRRIVATGGSDAHEPPDIIGLPLTVVWAERRTAAAIVAALRAGRCYIARSAALAARLVVQSGDHVAGVGEQLSCTSPQGPVQVEVEGADGAVARLYSGEGLIAERFVRGDAARLVWPALGGNVHRYLRLELRTIADELLLVSNPVWIGDAMVAGTRNM